MTGAAKDIQLVKWVFDVLVNRSDANGRFNRNEWQLVGAYRLNVSARTIWAWIASGRLRAIKLGPRTTRIPVAALEAFLADAQDA